MKNSLYNAIANISQSFYDKYVEVNVRFRARSGVKTVIVRRELGKCCDWCSQLAGIYNYGEAPDDIYRRHDNCRCMVTVRYEKGTYEDVWSKKEYASQREARIARAKEIEQEDALEELKRLRRKARSEGARFADTTEWYLNHPRSEHIIKDVDYIYYKGQRLVVDGSSVVFEHEDFEYVAAEAVIKDLGGEIVFVPEIKIPKSVHNFDVLFNGVKTEIKSPKGSGETTVFNNLSKAKKQADEVIISTSRTSLPVDRVVEDCKEAFSYKSYNTIKKIIVTDGKSVIAVLERIE